MFKNLSRFDKNLISFSALMICMLSYFLYDDSFLTGALFNNGSIEIGSISDSQNDVRRKFAADFMWTKAKKEQAVFQGDSIFTGEKSNALISLANGTEILIEENSLITLDFSNDELVLDLKFGQLEGTLAQNKIKLKENGKEVEVKSNNSKIKFNKPKVGPSNVKVLSGEAQITKNNEVKTLVENGRVEISETLKEIKEVDIETLALDSLVNIKDKTATFKWKPVKEVTQYEFILSESESFAKPILTNKTNLSEITLKNISSKDQVYWKLIGYNSDNKKIAESQINKTTLYQYLPVQIISPENKKEIVFKPENPKKIQTAVQIGFTNPQNNTNKYSIEVSQEPNFNKVIYTEQFTDDKNLNLYSLNLGPGTYFVRIKEQFEQDWNKNISWSSPVEMTLKVDEQALSVLTPEIAQSEIKFTPKIDKAGNIDKNYNPVITWDKVENTEDYTVEASTTPDFKNVTTMSTKTNKFVWKNYKLGQYYFRVKAKSNFNKVSDYSKTIKVSVLTTKPVLSPIQDILAKGKTPDDKGEPQNVKVNWTGVPLASQYKIEIDKTDKFSNPKVIESRTPASTVVIDSPGDYKMRVTAMDKDGRSIASVSNVESFKYILKNPLSIPKLIDPLDKMTVFLQVNIEPFIWLEWQTVNEAIEYVIEVAYTSDFKKPFIQSKTDKNKFLIKNKLNLGKTFWRVKANAADRSSEWSKPRSFILISGQDGSTQVEETEN